MVCLRGYKMSWYCKHCGKLSLNMICEHCNKPRETRLRIAIISLIGIIGIPILMYSIYYVGTIYAVELLVGYNSYFIDIIGIFSLMVIAPMGVGWIFVLGNWLRQDSILKEYWLKNEYVHVE